MPKTKTTKKKPCTMAGETNIIGRASELVPTSWLDPMIDVIGSPPYNCAHIEILCLAIKSKIEEWEKRVR